MRNPLRRRVPRELRGDWKKYLALFLLMTFIIGVVSGVYVANGSMEKAADGSFETYAVEDGHFTLEEKATEELVSALEERGVKIYDLFYTETDEDIGADGTADAVARVFQMREEIDRASLLEGEFPRRADEIVIDRMHADNNGIRTGDKLRLNGREMTVSGLAAFSDYSTLFKNNADSMFDAITFNVAAVTDEGYDALSGKETYQYAWRYTDRPADDAEKKEKSDRFVEQLAVLAATGGMLDDPDEADALDRDVKEWTRYLEGIGERADALKRRKEDLETLVASLSPAEQFARRGELTREADELASEAEALEAEQEKIDSVKEKLERLEPYEDSVNKLTDYVPEYANQAIHFAKTDFGTDKAMVEILLVIFIIVLAFIFAITASHTIVKESAVIGTLRASGYRKRELLFHYMTTPVLVTLVAAVIGNILGYTVFKDLVVGLYYNSYSLPTYTTIWSAEAFIKTTLRPVLIMLAVNLAVIWFKLRFDPLRFLRRDLSRSRKKKAVRLPDWSFIRRFRLRILFQNIPGYLTLWFGIFFVLILLVFSVGMPSTLMDYQSKAEEYVLAGHQIILKQTEDEDGKEIATSEPSAERYSVTSLETVDGTRVGEQVTVFGAQKGSRYFDLPESVAEGAAFISDSYAEKFSIEPGQTVTLKERYTSKTYDFKVEGIAELPGQIALFLPNDAFNERFGYDEGSFTGYLSEKEITDIDEEYIAGEVTVEDALVVAKQMDHSLGGFLNIFSYLCILIAMLVIFLLTKLIIERNASSISMIKVMGFQNREVSRLYIRLTTLLVVVFTAVNLAVSFLCVKALWALIMNRMNGWLPFYAGAPELIKAFAMVIIAYLIVAFIDMRRIRKIPLSEALKNAE